MHACDKFIKVTLERNCPESWTHSMRSEQATLRKSILSPQIFPFIETGSLDYLLLTERGFYWLTDQGMPAIIPLLRNSGHSNRLIKVIYIFFLFFFFFF